METITINNMTFVTRKIIAFTTPTMDNLNIQVYCEGDSPGCDGLIVHYVRFDVAFSDWERLKQAVGIKMAQLDCIK